MTTLTKILLILKRIIEEIEYHHDEVDLEETKEIIDLELTKLKRD